MTLRMGLLFAALIFSLGICAGEKLLVHAYNPDNLTEGVLITNQIAYVRGCQDVTRDLAYCRAQSMKFIADYSSIMVRRMWRGK